MSRATDDGSGETRIEPVIEETHDGDERASEVVEKQSLPVNNPFSDLVYELRTEGENWVDIFNQLSPVYDVLDEAAIESKWELMPEWRVAVVVSDPDTPSGERYETHKRVAETVEEAEKMVETDTGLPVDPEQSKQVAVVKVA
jgi:hypothetical protein